MHEEGLREGEGEADSVLSREPDMGLHLGTLKSQDPEIVT